MLNNARRSGDGNYDLGTAWQLEFVQSHWKQGVGMKAQALKVAAALAVLAGMSPISAVFAADQGPGLVQYIYVQNGVAIFTMSGAVSGSWPACATYHRYAFDLTTVAGQAWYATILSAKLAGRQLTITGAGSCSVWDGSENINYILMHP